MKTTIQKTTLNRVKDHTLIVPVYQQGAKVKLPKNGNFLRGVLTKLEKEKVFDGKFKKTAFVRYAASGPSQNILFLGLGKKDEMRRNRLREALITAAQTLQQNKVSSYTFHLSSTELYEKYASENLVQVALESLVLPLYTFHKFKKSPENGNVKSVSIAVDTVDQLQQGKKGISKTQKIIEVCSLVRDLVNTPHNDLTSVKFADLVKAEAKKAGLKVTIWGKKELEKEKFGAFLAVNQASDIPPRFVILEHKSKVKHAKTVCLVGKGITFDTGGISLKPSANLDEMRMDMAGAATVFGILLLAAKLNFPVNVFGFLCLTNNMPSGKATVPGDIVTAHNGKTIEILNTDAEGRLVLADGLSYADRTYHPDLLMDFATLTGACIIALGNQGTAMMGTDQKTMDALKKLVCTTGEHVWQLPIWDELKEEIISDNADLRNMGRDRGAGTAKAAAFLQNFVRPQTPWVHFDIAGTAFIPKPTNLYAPKGATAACVRLITEFLMTY